MKDLESTLAIIDRRRMLQIGAAGLGGMALADLQASQGARSRHAHHPAKAKRVIYLFQSGGPSQVDMFDYKPALQEHRGKEIFSFVDQQGRLTLRHQGHDYRLTGVHGKVRGELLV